NWLIPAEEKKLELRNLEKALDLELGIDAVGDALTTIEAILALFASSREIPSWIHFEM
ncbi:hypothetical protein ACMD2_23898, partial [Ananas comosus]